MIPKIILPIKSIKVPSLDREVCFSPFTVAAEKAVLTLDKEASPYERLTLIKNIVSNCCNDKSINFDKMNVYELPYLFLHLRKISVSGAITFSKKCEKCGKEIIYDINIDDIKYDADKQKIKKFKVNTDSGVYIVEVAFPNVEDFNGINTDNEESNIVFASRHIYRMYDEAGNNEVEFNKDDKLELFNSLPVSTAQEIVKYAQNIPQPYYNVNDVCSCGEKQEFTVTDFFI